MRRLVTGAPRGLAVGLHGFWSNALIALPLAMAGLAVAGYFVVAGYFWGRMMMSLFIVLGAVVLYGLMALWVQLQRFHLARLRREEALRKMAAEAPAEAGAETVDVPPPRLDIAAIGEQSRALLDLLVTLLLLAALWSVWKDALPNLSVVGDYALWSVTEKVDGAAVTRTLTVNGLLLTIVVAAVAALLVRNIGALLDMALLKRFDMQADATYAIKVIARYAIAAAGVLLVSRILGIAWSDAQWLIAALSVGLGFGLQEIVANFVSGLIVLTERPVRVGDVVTVGDVTGTVSGIRARSTRVIDFDNKEVIIPNKAFITEQVTNWTLANQITRLLLPLGVAYGSDIERVQKLLLEAARSNPDVLSTPSPSVFFVGFGDSSLNFEIRAYVDSFDKRLRVRHEIYVGAGRALDENGIEIPFPQRDLHIRSAPGLADVLPRGQAG
jgi:potassium efflux system protein